MSENPSAKTILENKTIEVEYGGDKFVFNIPGIMDEGKRSNCAIKLNRKIDPSGQVGVDDISPYLVGASYLMTFLRSGPEWVFSQDEEGRPVVDPWKWPPEKADAVIAIASKLRIEVNRFRAGLRAS